ncbi:hypothetical protein Vadar_005426 [Vaccinium darrowii]|uniref:Uncharacterized protein n=1 Tax=Vaccinium darrowii TaxID=229202 RepID=A0ACB7WYF3_9ERIC|nr:hypothetical protein Vadar_005426 [Vaccinium darrowii]
MNMQINLVHPSIGSQVVESKAGNKTVVVIPDKIAMYLGYERPPRSLKDGYWTMNKVTYNLYPRGNETPHETELEYVFMKEDGVTDYAKWIFDQIVEFKLDIKAGLNFLFPAMITELCMQASFKTNSPTSCTPRRPWKINARTGSKNETISKRASKGKSQPPSQAGPSATDVRSSSAQKPKVAQSEMMKITQEIVEVTCIAIRMNGLPET